MVSLAQVTMVFINDPFPSILQWASSSQGTATDRDPDSPKCSTDLHLSCHFLSRRQLGMFNTRPWKGEWNVVPNKLSNKLGNDCGFLHNYYFKIISIRHFSLQLMALLNIGRSNGQFIIKSKTPFPHWEILYWNLKCYNALIGS